MVRFMTPPSTKVYLGPRFPYSPLGEEQAFSIATKSIATIHLMGKGLE
jgi:hypothetical protein